MSFLNLRATKLRAVTGQDMFVYIASIILILFLLDNMRCRECGKPYKDTTSLLVHAARQHQVQGVNLPSRNEMIGVIDTSLQAEASMSGHGAISDAPPSEKKRKQENSIGAGGVSRFWV